jgi:hypothetical protein
MFIRQDFVDQQDDLPAGAQHHHEPCLVLAPLFDSSGDTYLRLLEAAVIFQQIYLIDAVHT